ncbi:PEPxxWA-CTERM sorting domain-containing protein [Sphingopyxis sp.]|uniref:PEPxxWA-CTERM sorting domain-containing protein n=1 Tax=Sphingopyxis sp. TaxID=1908224 RepID=UPI003BAB3409
MKFKNLAAVAALLVSSAAFAAPAHAALVTPATGCAVTDISPTAGSCVGWYSGNLNGGSPAMKSDSAEALNLLLGSNTLTGATLTWLEDLSPLSGNSINFAHMLYGDTIVSVHVGAANGQPTGVGYTSTAFFRFDAGSGLDVLTFNRAGLSNARLYSTGTVPGVPEPSTWAMMFLGFGLLGASLRNRQAGKSASMKLA